MSTQAQITGGRLYVHHEHCTISAPICNGADGRAYAVFDSHAESVDACANIIGDHDLQYLSTGECIYGDLVLATWDNWEDPRALLISDRMRARLSV